MQRSLVLLFAVASCFNPDLTNVPILCSAEPPMCPEGRSCVGGRCVEPGADLGAADGAAADMPGAAPDMSVPGCASGQGFMLSARAAACPGTFQMGGARKLCANGWVPCTMAAMVNLTTCATLDGWFAADQPAYWNGTQDQETCGTAIFNQLLYGCGKGGRAGYRKCGGFTNVLDISGGWSTTNGTLDKTANNNPKDGLLCCQ